MMEDDSTGCCTIGDWQRAYRDEQADPAERLTALLARLPADDPAWITVADAAFVRAQVAQLDPAQRHTLPLWGVPFAVKDNIDVAGLPTTAACPAFAFMPTQDAAVVARLRAAGAIVVGKTNLDQFATGLVGTRSPYGAVANALVPAHVSGGSSSGSASVVARGRVPFALGTDTAGSGRVPAGFNNLVGWKPTLGRQDMRGVVPACRSLDVVSVFALTVSDAALVAAVMEGPRPGGPQRPGWLRSPLRIGIPRIVHVDAAIGYDQGWARALAQAEAMGAEVVSVDMTPFDAVAALLYDGPWVAERYAAVQTLIESHPDALDPTVRTVIGQACGFDAVAAFKARYRLEALAAQTAPVWQDIDLLMVPTAPTCPTLAAVAAEPVARNSELGRYTNFVNLLGLAAVALPVGFTASGLPFGVTFIAPGGSDAALAGWGHAWEDALPRIGLPGAGGHVLGAGLRVAQPADRLPATPLAPLPASMPTLMLAVVGAHLQGLPLHGQLTERAARLVSRTRTAAQYRLHALPGTAPPKPGLARVAPGEAGSAIEVEVYEVPQHAVGSFLAMIPSPLGLGSVQLADGQWVHGFICEPWALADAPDISAFGGWRAYLASLT